MAKINKKHEFIARRRVARKLSLMAMYQWHLNGDDFQAIHTYYLTDKDMANDLRKADPEYFQALTEYAMQHADALDKQIEPYLDRPISQVGPIEHAVLQLASTELKNHPDVGYKTVVDEWVNLAKKFGPEKSYKFVNGVLDKIALETRKDELKSTG